MLNKQFTVYILTSAQNTVLYTGVTNNLVRRILEHRSGQTECFTKKYRIHKLVYFEVFPNAYDAIMWEKKIKAGSRLKKIKLIQATNPDWRDLSVNLL